MMRLRVQEQLCGPSGTEHMPMITTSKGRDAIVVQDAKYEELGPQGWSINGFLQEGVCHLVYRYGLLVIGSGKKPV